MMHSSVPNRSDRYSDFFRQWLIHLTYTTYILRTPRELTT